MAQHVVGDRDEAGEVGRGQVAEEGMGGGAAFAVHPLRGGRALHGEADKGRAPVSRVGTSGDPTIAFENVDERGDVPRCASQGLTELALNHRPTVVVQHQQDLGAGRSEPAFGQGGVHDLTHSTRELEHLVERGDQVGLHGETLTSCT